MTLPAAARLAGAAASGSDSEEEREEARGAPAVEGAATMWDFTWRDAPAAVAGVAQVGAALSHDSNEVQ
jgi:hypothetical protein